MPYTTNMRASITLQPTLDDCGQQAICPVHATPVILISGSTTQAYLIVTAVLIDARPRKSV
jgi:hypothetical protein